MNKAVFINRNFILIEGPNLENLPINQYAFKFLNILSDKGFLICVMTNSILSMGFPNYRTYDDLIERTINYGVSGNKAFNRCIHEKEEKCNCKFPNPGLIKQFVEEYDLDLTESLFLVNSEEDIKLAINAGFKKVFSIIDTKKNNKITIIDTKTIEEFVKELDNGRTT